MLGVRRLPWVAAGALAACANVAGERRLQAPVSTRAAGEPDFDTTYNTAQANAAARQAMTCMGLCSIYS